MTDAEDTVEEREMLSVEAFRRELNKEAARERFLTGESAGGTSGLEVLGLLLASSGPSSSRRAEDELRERARRRRPLRPPVRTMAGVGTGSSSLSSLDMRFSAAVKVPCDKGEGRTGRAGSDEVDGAGGRGETVDVDELEDGLRLWGMRWVEEEELAVRAWTVVPLLLLLRPFEVDWALLVLGREPWL
jgi:hypothetical protein